MIKSFFGKEAERLFNRERSRKLPHTIQRVALRKLWMLDSATCLDDLRVPPSNHLEIMKGKQKRLYSIRINKQWRICFKWEKGNAYNVNIVDYH